MEESRNEFSLETIVEWVCLRPHMTTHDGKFESVANFINGFVCGRGGTTNKEMEGFHIWLQEWLAGTGHLYSEVPRNYVWQWYIKQVYSDDADAMKNLPILFKEYLRHAKNR